MTATPSTLGRSVRTALRVDPGLVSPVAGAVTAVPVVAVFAAGMALGDPRAAISMAIGANLIAVASLVGAPRLPIGLAVADAAGLGVSVFVGSATVHDIWLHVPLLALWCAAAGMLVVFGQTQATAGTQAVIAFVVLGRFSGSPTQALELGGLVVAGAAVEIAALLTLRLPPTLRVQRRRLADGFAALARIARRAPDLPTGDVAATVDDADRALSSPSLFGRADARDLRAALDQGRRIRLELSVLAGLRVRLTVSGPARARAAADACLEHAAVALDGIGARLRERRPASRRPPDGGGDDTFERATELLEATAPGDALVRQCAAHVAALGGQIRAAAHAVALAGADERRPGRPRPRPTPRRGTGRLRRDLGIVRANLRPDAPPFRHAVRLAVAVPASALVASGLHLPRGYWIPFAVTVILRPDYSTLFLRGLGRVVGTLAGATAAAVVVAGLHPGPVATTVLVGITAWAAYASWAASFALSMAFVTALVLILLSTSLTDTLGTAVDRLVDVLLGGAVAFGAYLLWPSPSQAGVGDAQSVLFAAQRDYLAAVLDLVEGRSVAPELTRARSRAARLAWTRAEAVVGRSLQEPRTRADPEHGRGILAVALRIVRAVHALRIEAEAGATVEAFDDLDRLGEGLTEALTAVSDRLARRPHGPLPDLRPRCRAVARGLAARGAPESVALELDELVNAVDTAAVLAGVSPAPDPAAPGADRA